MAITTTLPMSDIVKINVNFSPRSTVRNAFDLALIVGESTVITTEERVKIYSSTDAMLKDGFTAEMPEYKTASRMFMQKAAKIAVGRWDKTENAETFLQAVQACRAKNTQWYILLAPAADAQAIPTLAEYIESVTPAAVLFYTTADISLLESMKGLKYRRSFGQYSEKYPKDAVAGIAGWAMANNTGLANSAYTLAYKQLIGMETEDFDETKTAAVFAANGNCYVNRGGLYDGFEQGTMADGTWFDEIINLDMLVNDMQLSLMDLLYSVKKIPQTEGGVNMVKNVMIDPLEKARKTGFLAGGIWKGAEVLGLQYGDAIETGYLVQSEPVSTMSQADRDARLMPPFYVALKTAGAVHHVVVQFDLNR